MEINAANEYFLKKKALLKQCLSLSEELISNIENWESLSDILSRRETVLWEIKELEEFAGPEMTASLTEEEKHEIDQTVKLILDLDKDSARLIHREQENILDSLRANAQGRKLTQYAQIFDPAQGRKLDYKK